MQMKINKVLKSMIKSKIWLVKILMEGFHQNKEQYQFEYFTNKNNNY